MQARVLAVQGLSLRATVKSDDEINDRTGRAIPRSSRFEKSSIQPMPKSKVARTKLSTAFVRKAGLVDFELPATQRELSGGTSTIRKVKIHRGTIITTTTMPEDCGLF